MKTILVDNDESSFRKPLLRALQAKGLLALEAANYLNAILAAAHEVSDRLVCDVEMPNGTGLEASPDLVATLDSSAWQILDINQYSIQVTYGKHPIAPRMSFHYYFVGEVGDFTSEVNKYGASLLSYDEFN
jgi:hypothetical protein